MPRLLQALSVWAPLVFSVLHYDTVSKNDSFGNRSAWDIPEVMEVKEGIWVNVGCSSVKCSEYCTIIVLIEKMIITILFTI